MGRLSLVWLAVTIVALCDGRASAWPTLPVRPIADAIAGPADPHVAGIFYNPAAIGPLRGVRVWYDNSAGIQLGQIKRAAGEGAQAGQTTPITNPSVGGFVGATWDLFTDRIVLGLGVLTPATELTQFRSNSAVRYKDIWQRSAILEEDVAVGVRISSRFYIGASANFGQGWTDYRFARDIAPQGGSAAIDQPSARCGGQACGLENPLATQDVRVHGFGWGIGFSLGALVRPIDRLWLAVSYVSHLFDPYRGVDLPLNSAKGVAVTQAPGSPDPDCGGACVARSRITVLVPDVIMFGVRIEATPRLEVAGQFRWVHYGGRNALDMYVQGGNIGRLKASDATSAVPSLMRVDRGWQDAYMIGGSVRIKVTEKLRLSPSLFYESSPVALDHVSAANLEGHKLDFALTLEWKPRAHLTVGAHVGGTTWFNGEDGQVYDPRAEARCVDSSYALDACGKHIAGSATSSAAGRYTMGALHAGFALGMDY
ncbi:MAG: outer membrane protein transport protein [Polyangia bacterium]